MKKKISILLSFIFICLTSFSQNPSNLTVDSTTANSATVTWQNGGCNTNNYILSYKNNNLSNWDSIIVSNSNFLSSYTISSLNGNTTYNWRVKCDTLGSTYSSGSNFTTLSCFSFSYLVTDASCDGNNDGAIDLTILGGISPLNYSLQDNLLRKLFCYLIETRLLHLGKKELGLRVSWGYIQQ